MLIIPRTHGLELAEFVRPFLPWPGNEAALGSGWSDWPTARERGCTRKWLE